MLRLLLALAALSGYPALAWWLRARYDGRALVAAWLGASLLSSAPVLWDLARYPEAPRVLGLIVPIFLIALGLSAWSVHRSVLAHPEPPATIPMAALARSLSLLIVSGAVLVFCLSWVLHLSMTFRVGRAG